DEPLPSLVLLVHVRTREPQARRPLVDDLPNRDDHPRLRGELFACLPANDDRRIHERLRQASPALPRPSRDAHQYASTVTTSPRPNRARSAACWISGRLTPVDEPPSANAARKSSMPTDESPPAVSEPVSSSCCNACDASTG